MSATRGFIVAPSNPYFYPAHQSLCAYCAARAPLNRRASCAAATVQAVEIRFNVPYRVNFGQSLGIVGSSDVLGNWDPTRRVPMEWSDGDVWQAFVRASDEVRASALEYKYVVVEQNGHISHWKPGENITLTLDDVGGQVAVRDTWDGSMHEISVEVPAGQGAASKNAGASAFRAGTSADSSDKDADLKSALAQAYGELEDTLQATLQLVDAAVDPADPRLLMNDQKLAAVSRKAISLSRALEAGAPPPAYILRDLEAQTDEDNKKS